jgi:hypothetical protein
MSYILLFEDSVSLEYQKAIDYYDDVSIELGNRFEHDFKQTLQYVKQFPLHFSASYHNIRIALFENFPFSIHFMVEGNVIFILKVIHTKRFFKQ